MYRLNIYNIKGDSSHLLANPYLETLVVVAVLAVVVDDVHVLAGAHLLQVVHSGAD